MYVYCLVPPASNYSLLCYLLVLLLEHAKFCVCHANFVLSLVADIYLCCHCMAVARFSLFVG